MRPITTRSTAVMAAIAMLGVVVAVLPSLAAAAPSDEDKPAASLPDPNYADGKAAIEAKDWSAAIRSLTQAAARDGENADIHNYLGYAYRKTGQLDRAFDHYQRALRLDPAHRGVHEYIGEAYLMVDDLARAQGISRPWSGSA